MSSNLKQMLLKRAVYRASANPTLMASALFTCTGMKGGVEQLSKVLGYTQEQLIKLALCLRPELDSDQLEQDVKRISLATHISEADILNILRQAESICVMQKRQLENNDQALLAARDRYDTLDDDN